MNEDNASAAANPRYAWDTRIALLPEGRRITYDVAPGGTASARRMVRLLSLARVG
jgi:hypothetical protein